MKVSEILIEEPVAGPSKLVQVLRTVISSADQKGQTAFLHFDKPTKQNIKQGALNLDLNKLMQNVGGEQFDFGTFKAAYDTDPRVKTMVKNFSAAGVEPKTKENEKDEPQVNEPGGDTVASMAKSATDLGNNDLR
jgi:hypothetical protein